MELSLVTNKVCPYTGEEEKFLIGITDVDGRKTYLSRECLETALRILNAVQPVAVELPAYQREIASVEGLDAVTTRTVATPMVAAKPAQPKKPANKTANANEAKLFVKELEEQQKLYLEENESKKNDGSISNTAIKRSIASLKHKIPKERMFDILKRTLGIPRERFEVDYNMAGKE